MNFLELRYGEVRRTGIAPPQTAQDRQRGSRNPRDTLEGATMPNGQKYEDWLKSKDQGEMESENDNSGSS